MDFIFLSIFLLLSVLFLGVGLWKREWLFGFIGSVFLLLLGLLIMQFGVDVYAGFTANNNATIVSNQTGGLGGCWNETSYYYNSSFNLTGTANTTTCACLNNFNQTNSELGNSSVTYLRLDRDFEMALAVIIMLVAFYFMYDSVMSLFNQRREKKGEY